MAQWVIESAAPAPAKAGGGRWVVDDTLRRDVAFSRGLRAGVSFGWGDELAGVGAGLQAAAQGDDYDSAYQRQAEASRAALAEAEAIHPWSTGGGQVAGAALTSLVPGGAVARGAGVGGRLALAATAGAGAGALQGAGEGITPEERLRGGGLGAAYGMAFGLGGGALGEAIPGAWRAGKKALGLPAVPGRMGVAEMARDKLTALAKQNTGLGVRAFDDLGPVMAGAAAKDNGLTVAEALGRPAINQVAKYSRLPGRTATRAEQVLEKNAETFDDLTQRLDATLAPRDAAGATLTIRGASNEIDAAFESVSELGYQPAFQQKVSRDSAQQMGALVTRYPGLFDRAVKEAQEIARGDGLNLGGNTSDPRLWHYIKVAAGDTIRSMRREGLGATRARQYTGAIRQLTDELDRVPGYRAARQQWGSLAEARDAVDAGMAFDRMLPRDMQDAVARLTPFQRRYMKAGVTQRIRDVLEARDNDGLTNIAKTLTGRRNNALLREVFGDSNKELDDFLALARTKSQSFKDRVRMASSQNSVTGLVTGEIPEELRPPPTLTGALWSGAQKAYGAAAGKANERSRDVLGRILLTDVGEFQRAGTGLLTRARREAARREARRRLDATRGALNMGLGAAGIYSPVEQ